MAELLSILLQRSDPRYPWGFSVRGGAQEGTPLTISQVTPGTLAAKYLTVGDTILQIEKADTRQLWNEQVEELINRHGRSLDLLVMKGTGSDHRRSVTSPSPKEPKSSVYNPADSAAKSRKQEFWDRVSGDRPDYCKETFTRLDGSHSPYRSRPRADLWKRCQSEERTSSTFEDLSEGQGRTRKLSDAGYSSRLRSIWSPILSDRGRTPTPSSWLRGDERQGDVTFWEYTPDQSCDAGSMRGEHENDDFKKQHSEYGNEYSSLSSGYASSSRSNATPTAQSPVDFSDTFMRKPSDFWKDHFGDDKMRFRFETMTSPTKGLDKLWKSANISSKTEFKKSTSVSEKTYSTSEGSKTYEAYEHVNKIKESERSTKTGENGREEVVEKTKKNKEYVLANKDDVNGTPKETKKVVNDFKVTERATGGEQEYCNKTKERSEEVTNSATPVDFYDNVQQQEPASAGVVPNHSAPPRDPDPRSMAFSPLLLNKDSARRRWMSSTPIPEDEVLEDGYVYRREEPLQESYFEVDIRSPIETQLFYPSVQDHLRRQSSQISGGGSPVPTSPQGEGQVAPPPPPSFPPAPPPPPPPGLPGALPAVRLSSEIADKRRSGYEPPAAIQNAMMTKDKKPFTYTPGGLDLSEIRSPRMARRINRNAHTPDMPAPNQSRPMSMGSQPLPPAAMAAMQPQIAVAVLPQGPGGVSQLHHGNSSAPPPPPPPPQLKSQPTSPLVQSVHSPPVQSTPPPPPPKFHQPTSPVRVVNRQPSPPPISNSVPKLQPQHRHTKSEPQSSPGSIYVPPLEQQQPRSQLGSLYIPPIAPQEPNKPQTPSQLNKAPTPWMSRQTQQSPKEVPAWAQRDNTDSLSPTPQQFSQNQQPSTRIIPIQVEGKETSQPNTRIIPIQLEKTPSPQYRPVPPNYQQPQSPQHQQPAYQQHPVYQQQPAYQQQPTYQQQQSYEQPTQARQNTRWMNQQPVYTHNKFNSGSQSPVPADQNWRHSQSNGNMQSPGPVQSQSFKVLQKITGTDNGEVDQTDSTYNSQGVPLSQLRKMQLSDDDRALMNKVKSQVDDETFLHSEADPRYRGSAIPSRAFRILQTMTDSAGEDSDVPQAYSPAQGLSRTHANRTPQPDAPQQYIPPSEQQVQEPRKYTGGAIPSRSFRMLQAMTASPHPADRPGESEF